MLIKTPESHLSQSETRARHLPKCIISPWATSQSLTRTSHVTKIVVMLWSFIFKTTRASSSFSPFSFATYFKCLSKSSASTAAPLNSSIIFLWPPALNFSYLCFPSRIPRTLPWLMAPTAIFPDLISTQPVHHTLVMPLLSHPCSRPFSKMEFFFYAI